MNIKRKIFYTVVGSVLFITQSAFSQIPIVSYDQLPLTLDTISTLSSQLSVQKSTLATGVDTNLGLGSAGSMSGNGVLGTTGLTQSSGSSAQSKSPSLSEYNSPISENNTNQDATGWFE